MEFGAACVYRMREILFDLSMKLAVALKNIQYSTDTRKITSQSEVLLWEKGFLEHLAQFNDIVNIRMETNPTKKIKYENYLHESSVALKDAHGRVQVIKSAVNGERSYHGKITDAIWAEITVENMLLEKINGIYSMEITGKMEQSRDEMRKIHEENAMKTKQLEGQINGSKTCLEDALSTKSLMNERELYRKRSKVEAKYLAVLMKYDTNIGAFHNTMEDLTDKLYRLGDELKGYRIELAVQNVQYVEFKDERELAILKAFTEDLENFEKTRAAKVIQRAWRIYYERCYIRKKKKSKKKK